MIPEQNTGIATNTESEKKCSSREEATAFFNRVKERLLHVNGWQHLAGPATATFVLTDEKGVEVNREAQKGDHFKIDIPGPGPATGDGFDWVKVEEIEEETGNEVQRFSINVRPATNPTNDRKDVAHFFSDEATSCFMVKREGDTVKAGVYGRNEKPNTAAEKVVDKARNTAIATGAISGFAKLQWKSLVNGLLKE